MEEEKLENITLYNADCMEVMKDIPDKYRFSYYRFAVNLFV